MDPISETAAPSLDRRGLVILNLAECERLLAENAIGRVGLMSAGEPVVLPIIYRYFEGAVVFRTEPGEKMDAVWMQNPMAFEIDGWDFEQRTGWSVLLRGRAETVNDDEEIARYESLQLDSWLRPSRNTKWVRLRPFDISGRRIPRADELAD